MRKPQHPSPFSKGPANLLQRWESDRFMMRVGETSYCYAVYVSRKQRGDKTMGAIAYKKCIRLKTTCSLHHRLRLRQPPIHLLLSTVNVHSHTATPLLCYELCPYSTDICRRGVVTTRWMDKRGAGCLCSHLSKRKGKGKAGLSVSLKLCRIIITREPNTSLSSHHEPTTQHKPQI